MSRHTARFDGKELNWGFDPPIGEYFIQLWDSKDVEDPIFAVGNRMVLTPHPDHPKKMDWSQEEITALYESFAPHIPTAHIEAIKAGLPI